MSDIKIKVVNSTVGLGNTEYSLCDGRGLLKFDKGAMDECCQMINTHDDLVKKVAELKEALVEVSEQTIDLFSYTIDKENYYSGHIYDCLVNDEVETIRLMVKAALKESEK